jgi:hypothetical protein
VEEEEEQEEEEERDPCMYACMYVFCPLSLLGAHASRAPVCVVVMVG